MNQVLAELSSLTVLAGTVWLSTALVSVCTLVLAALRPSYAGWRGGTLGHSALVLGLLVGAARTPETLLPSVLLGNGLLLVGAALYTNAFQRFSGRVPRRATVLGWAAAGLGVLAALAVLTVMTDQLALRFVLVSTYLAGLTGVLIRLIVREWQQEPELRTAYGLNLGVLLLIAGLTVPKAVQMGRGPTIGAFDLTVPNALLYVGALLLSVGGSFAFWTLHQDRRRRDLQRMYDELDAQARRDPLTGLLNRRGLWQAHAAWAARGAEQGATLVALDLNDFKGLNDHHGHAAGDAALQVVAAAHVALAGPGDLLARIGGDEFIALLTGAPARVAAQVDQLSEVLELQGVGAYRCTASLGVTTLWPQEALDQGLQRADQALYQAKSARRRRLERVWAEVNTPARERPN